MECCVRVYKRLQLFFRIKTIVISMCNIYAGLVPSAYLRMPGDNDEDESPDAPYSARKEDEPQRVPISAGCRPGME